MDRSTIDEKISSGDLSGLIFHGTGEPFDSPLQVSSYDGALWTADSPVLAQSYIPQSGITMLLSREYEYARYICVRPSPQSGWYQVVRAMGFEALEVEIAPDGDLMSWRLPNGYPTHADAEDWIERMGYEARAGGVYEIKTHFINGVETLMPNDWRLPGRLFVSSSEGLNLFDYAQGREGDLGDPDYHHLDLFRGIEMSGYDGIIINDFLQDSIAGNVGHRSIGLFAGTLPKLEWIELPATHHVWDRGAQTTPDLDAYRSSLHGQGLILPT